MTAQLPTDPAARKKLPVFSGFLAYFPDACVAVAEVSQKGNEQHNPGEPLHWAREKSTDHEDCIARHMLELGHYDNDGVRHAAKLAWRAMAVLQLEIEAEQDLVQADFDSMNTDMLNSPPGPLCCDSPAPMPDRRPLPHDECDCDTCIHLRAAEPGDVEYLASEIAKIPMPTIPEAPPTFRGEPVRFVERLSGSDSPNVKVTNIETSTPRCYIVGPMTGYERFNFDAFDEAEDILSEECGYDPISPANLDREAGIDPCKISDLEDHIAKMTVEDLKKIIWRDLTAIMGLDPDRGDALAVLPGWEKSTGSMAEVMLGRWIGLKLIHAMNGEPVRGVDIEYTDICTVIYDYLNGKAGLR